MTTKFLALNSISIRPQNDTEKIMLSNINAMLLAGKKVNVSFKESDILHVLRGQRHVAAELLDHGVVPVLAHIELGLGLVVL